MAGKPHIRSTRKSGSFNVIGGLVSIAAGVPGVMGTVFHCTNILYPLLSTYNFSQFLTTVKDRAQRAHTAHISTAALALLPVKRC